ncbi:MAG: MBL fold metallo-hydrolase [Anaerolineae bacterium]
MDNPKLHQITPRVYWLEPDERTDRPILGAIAGRRATLMVDAGNSPAHAQLFLDELAAARVAPPNYCVLTHWHWDHVFGASALDVPTFAYRDTQRKVIELAGLDWSDEALDRRVAEGTEIEFCRDMLKVELPDRTGLRLRPPEIAFTGQLDLDLGGLTAHIIHVGGDHSADSSIVYVPEEKVLFLSDCWYQNLYHNPPSYTTRKLFPLLERLLSFDAEFYLEGHNPEPLSRAEMEQYASLLKTIGQKVDQIGPHRDEILADLAQVLAEPPEEYVEIVDAFIAGLQGNMDHA